MSRQPVTGPAALPQPKVVRCPSKAKQLAKTFGGQWTYNGLATWYCDDGKRHVSRCAASCDEADRFPCEYWLYGDGMPYRIWFSAAGCYII